MATFTEINLFDAYTSDGSIYKWAGDTVKTKYIVEDEQAFLAALSREFNQDNNLVRDFGKDQFIFRFLSCILNVYRYRRSG